MVTVGWLSEYWLASAVRYQLEMICHGALKFLAKLIEDKRVQPEVVKTIAYFDGNLFIACELSDWVHEIESHQQLMIDAGIFSKLVELITQKNAKSFLQTIEKFYGNIYSHSLQFSSNFLIRQWTKHIVHSVAYFKKFRVSRQKFCFN